MRNIYSIFFLLFWHGLFSQVSVGLEWEKYFGQKDKLEARALIQNLQGNIVVVGDAKNTNRGQRDAFFMELNQDGNILDSKIDFLQNHGGRANAVVQTPDGGYIVVGCVETKIGKSERKKSAWLMKLDEEGEILWTKIKKEANSEFYDLAQDKEGNLVACGYAMNKGFVSHFSFTGDSLQKDMKYGDGDYPLKANSIINTVDNGFALIANIEKEKSRSGYIVLKLNEKGGKVWERSWHGYEAHDIIQDKSDDIVITGAKQNGFANTMKTTHRSNLFIQKMNLKGTEITRIIHQKNSDKDTGYAVIQGFNKDYYIVSQSDYAYDIPKRADRYGQQIWLQHLFRDPELSWYYGQVLFGDSWKLLPSGIIQLCDASLIIIGFTPKSSVIAKIIPRDYPEYHETIFSINDESYQEIKGNNNGILEPEERAYYSFYLRNEGEHDVYNVVATINDISQKNDINYFYYNNIGHIAAGDSKLVQIPIIADDLSITGKDKFNIELTGFNNKYITSMAFEINSSATSINSVQNN